MARPRPFSNAALIAEFKRIKGSGRPEDAIRDKRTRLALVASIKSQRQAERKTPTPRRPADDYKRRQANDID
jgi:hypothetical protein